MKRARGQGVRILLERAKRHSTAVVHAALFPDTAQGTTPAKMLDELKQGIRQHMQHRHAGA